MKFQAAHVQVVEHVHGALALYILAQTCWQWFAQYYDYMHFFGMECDGMHFWRAFVRFWHAFWACSCAGRAPLWTC